MIDTNKFEQLIREKVRIEQEAKQRAAQEEEKLKGMLKTVLDEQQDVANSAGDYIASLPESQKVTTTDCVIDKMFGFQTQTTRVTTEPRIIRDLNDDPNNRLLIFTLSKDEVEHGENRKRGFLRKSVVEFYPLRTTFTINLNTAQRDGPEVNALDSIAAVRLSPPVNLEDRIKFHVLFDDINEVTNRIADNTAEFSKYLNAYQNATPLPRTTA